VDDAEIHFPLDDFAALDLSLDRFHIVASYRRFCRQLSQSQLPNNYPQIPQQLATSIYGCMLRIPLSLLVRMGFFGRKRMVEPRGFEPLTS
jgi:hypothetical protein